MSALTEMELRELLRQVATGTAEEVMFASQVILTDRSRREAASAVLTTALAKAHLEAARRVRLQLVPSE